MKKKNAYLISKYLKKKVGMPYLYGFKQSTEWNKKCTNKEFDSLQKQYGKKMVWDSDRKKCVGKTPNDCSGAVTSAIGGKQRGSSQYYDDSKKRIQIRTPQLNMDVLKKIPVGAGLWQKGHIGLFIGWKGNVPYYVAEDGSAYGCRIEKVSKSSFTHALILPDVDYPVEEVYKLKCMKRVTSYTSSVSKKKKRTFKKGTELHIVAEYNGRGLCRKYSKDANCWVDLNDPNLKKIK